MTDEEYLNYRRLVITSFAVEAGRLLGMLNAHYELLTSDGLDVTNLVEALEKLRKSVNLDLDNLS